MGTLLLENGRIWTNNPERPWASAALSRDGRLVAVAAASDIAAPAGCERLDLEGRLALPGFIDAHAHLLGVGYALRSVDLKGTSSVEQAVHRVEERLRGAPAGGWITGAGWDQHLWPGGRFPHRRDLDAVAPDRPVVLEHTSGHCSWVNSAALLSAGITRDTPSPDGGIIERDEHGEPTGILVDNAARLVYGAMPRTSQAERIATLEAAIAHAHHLGVTCVHAMNVSRGEFQALHALNDAGRLRLRVREYLSHERLDEWLERGIETTDGDEMLRVAGVKFFADGALGPLTAWMSEPYEGTDNRGLPRQPVEHLERDVRRCLDHGLATAVHAIGDRANAEVLDIYERVRDVSPGLLRRIEHAQLLHAADVPRFAALRVVASMQPIHATQDMAKVDRWWGDRARGAYAFASLLASGASLAFGSDAPVETMDPLAGLHAAVTRRTAAGEPAHGWHAEHRISLAQALAAYTSGAAAAAGDGHLGRLSPGCSADAVVLSDDIFAADDPMGIRDAHVVLTVVAGEVVYRAPGV
jgi:predicted amidohydrolase YtcJ